MKIQSRKSSHILFKAASSSFAAPFSSLPSVLQAGK
jgi:hypothetical protein